VISLLGISYYMQQGKNVSCFSQVVYQKLKVLLFKTLFNKKTNQQDIIQESD